MQPARMQPDDGYWLADDDDCWVRHVLEAKSVRGPRLKVKYLENCLELVTGRPWEAEISGRLLSLANDIREKADAEAARIGKPGIRFRHVAYIMVVSVRAGLNWDVYAEPNEDDEAHANLVAYQVRMAPVLSPDAHPKFEHEFLKIICDNMQICDESDLGPLEALRA
jgi:hypothetical protein